MKLVLFSGGYDSTYLLNKLMQQEKELLVLIIEPSFSPGKIEREKVSRKRILKYLEAKYFNCKLIINTIKLDISNFHISDTRGLTQPLFWLPSIMMLGYSEDIEINFSYISGDQAPSHMDSIDKIIEGCNSFRNGNKLSIKYPILYMTKAQIITELIKNDKFLLENSTTCKSPNEKDNCGICTPCIHLKSALIEIMMTDDFDDTVKEYASAVLNLIEDLLEENDVTIPDEDREGDEGEARLYGGTYYELEEKIVDIMQDI